MKLILLLLSVAYFIPSSANDLNLSGGLSCSPKHDNSTTTSFKTNLNSLLSILEEEGPRNHGFYISTTGTKSDKIYGLVQCRGDVSAQDCGTCIKGAVNETFNICKNSNYAVLMFRWCFLRYSNEYFCGRWKGWVTVAMPFDNTTATDDPTVVTIHMNFMSQLTDCWNPHVLMITNT